MDGCDVTNDYLDKSIAMGAFSQMKNNKNEKTTTETVYQTIATKKTNEHNMPTKYEQTISKA